MVPLIQFFSFSGIGWLLGGGGRTNATDHLLINPAPVVVSVLHWGYRGSFERKEQRVGRQVCRLHCVVERFQCHLVRLGYWIIMLPETAVVGGRVAVVATVVEEAEVGWEGVVRC